MDNRSNVIAMMVLGAGIVALGSSLVSREMFMPEKLEKPAYIVDGVVEDAAGPATPEVAEIPIALALQTADATKGAEVFKKCAGCHSIAQGGANGTGPNLWGTLGEEIGKGKGGYAFSEALSGKGGKWDFESMNTWLTKPSAYAPGTKMSFAGITKVAERADVIAYLNSQGSNLPLPPPPATAAPAAAGAAASNAAAPANASAPAKK